MTSSRDIKPGDYVRIKESQCRCVGDGGIGMFNCGLYRTCKGWIGKVADYSPRIPIRNRIHVHRPPCGISLCDFPICAVTRLTKRQVLDKLSFLTLSGRQVNGWWDEPGKA